MKEQFWRRSKCDSIYQWDKDHKAHCEGHGVVFEVSREIIQDVGTGIEQDTRKEKYAVVGKDVE